MTKSAIYVGGALTVGLIAALWLAIAVKTKNIEPRHAEVQQARVRIGVLSRGLAKIKAAPAENFSRFAEKQVADDNALIASLEARMKAAIENAPQRQLERVGAPEEIASQLKVVEGGIARLRAQLAEIQGKTRAPSSTPAMIGLQQQLNGLRGQEAFLRAELARRRDSSAGQAMAVNQIQQELRFEQEQIARGLLEARVDRDFWKEAKFERMDQAISGMEKAIADEKEHLKGLGAR